MTEPSSIAEHNARAVRDQQRLRELGAASRTLRDLCHRLRVASETLDSMAFFGHEDGLPIEAISTATQLSVEDLFEAIDRHRSTLT